MEPRNSMSWFAFAIVLACALCVLTGFARATAWTGGGLLALGGFLHGLYLFERRGGRPVPPHRRALDRIVRVQWIAAGGAGVALGLAGRRAGVEPFTHVGVLFDAIVVGLLVMWLGVFVSSMVDWYLILPKVSGISCPAPCEANDGERWTSVTNLWYFHRGVAPLLVIGVIVGVPAYVGAISDDPKAQQLCAVVAGLLAAFIVNHQSDAVALLRYAFNGRRLVGDVVWLIEHDGGGAWIRRRPAYVVDVAREGSKFKWLQDDGAYAGPRFDCKGDADPVPNEELRRARDVAGAAPPCASACTGVNWYCRHNPLAHSQSVRS
jgi:hypothetical protein